MFISGFAFKKSKFATFEELLHAIKHADFLHSCSVLDYEGKEHLLSGKQIQRVLNEIGNKLFLTVAVRGRELSNSSFINSYLGLLHQNYKMSFCIVAGHPAYSSINKLIKKKKGFYQLIQMIRRFTERPLLIGMENISTRF